ncbi:MAG: glycosyltransferase family 2 protein [Atopobiaceae bacterium]|jgi:glycosyltransferase involved in cell wall biosynthesis|nr:glycosyltransferase family 2 protein [Atopobiaceae bacterium]MCI2173123.1 glycosyltransferase family 2 protein [Atopobiaceae bacterium]MCI2208216.1 glycosyltransferase family 2 protein [Atopobiaceae bacterium]
MRDEMEPNMVEGDDAPVMDLVIPCFDEQEVLPTTAGVVGRKMRSLMESGVISSKSRIIFVDDGSTDATWQIISSLHASDPSVMDGIKLAHNRGHQNALLAGLMEALRRGCDAAVSMDADLQDDPDAIDEMLEHYRSGEQIVYGVRSARDTDTHFKRDTAHAFYGLMRKMGTEVVDDCADFRLMGRPALEALSRYGEVNLFLRGIVPTLGFRTGKVFYERAERAAGTSKYPLRKMMAFAIQGITSFTAAPMHWVMGAGVIAVLFSIVMIVYTLVSMALGHVVSGWSSLMISVWLVGGLIMISLGVVGEYVGKIYLETKHRPRYTIEERLD